MAVSDLLLFILVMAQAISHLPVLAIGYYKGPGNKYDGLHWSLGDALSAKKNPASVVGNPLELSAYSSSYFPVKQKISGKKHMNGHPLSFPPMDIVETSLHPAKFPPKKDMHLHFWKKGKGKGMKMMPLVRPKGKHWISKLARLKGLKQMIGPPNGGPVNANVFGASNIPAVGFNTPGPSINMAGSFRGGTPGFDIPNISLGPNNNNIDISTDRRGPGAVDIPYTVEKLGIRRTPGGGGIAGGQAPQNNLRAFEIVPITVNGNDVIVGNANDVVLNKNRNPKVDTIASPSALDSNSLSTKIEGVDFASEIKNRANSIPIHGQSFSIQPSLLDVTPTPPGLFGPGLEGINLEVGQDSVSNIGGVVNSGIVSFDSGTAAVGDNVNNIDFGVDSSVILTKTGVGGNDLGSDNSNANLAYRLQLPGATVVENLNDRPRVDDVDSQTFVSVNTVIGGQSEVGRGRGGTWFRYNGYMSNIEPFGPGPYGECRLPSQVICGARPGWEHVTGMKEWCTSNCVVYMYSSYCDDDRCECNCTRN